MKTTELKYHIGKLDKIADMLLKLEERVATNEKNIADGFMFNIFLQKANRFRIKAPKIKTRIENLLQKELAYIVKLELLDNDILFPILDEIKDRIKDDYLKTDFDETYDDGFSDGKSYQKHGSI